GLQGTLQFGRRLLRGGAAPAAVLPTHVAHSFESTHPAEVTGWDGNPQTARGLLLSAAASEQHSGVGAAVLEANAFVGADGGGVVAVDVEADLRGKAQPVVDDRGHARGRNPPAAPAGMDPHA